MRPLLLIALVLASPAVADDLPLPVPVLMDVSGVAADDVLNIRAFPDASGEIIGTLDPGAAEIEVVDYSRTSDWALVNSAESSGWVAARFLTESAPEIGAFGLPSGFSCSGTEPFWSLQIFDDALEVTTPGTIDGVDIAVHPVSAIYPDTPGPRDLSWGMLILWSEDGEARQARVIPGQCSDGMSDRAYGLHFVDPVIGYGCCSLAN